MALFNALYAEGNTVLLVTHEPEIAQYAERLIRIRDGLIDLDERHGKDRQPQSAN
jgi:putative ABC transport system ATP-binding protein